MSLSFSIVITTSLTFFKVILLLVQLSMIISKYSYYNCWILILWTEFLLVSLSTQRGQSKYYTGRIYM